MTETRVKCESCGMPVEMGPYCPHCVDDAGKLQPLEERFERTVAWRLRQAQGLSRAEGEQRTRARMRTMPAWRWHPGLA
jgi:hypothetical protein